jgi:PEGA domain
MPATNCADLPNFTLTGKQNMAAEKWGFGIGALAALALSGCVQLGSIPNPLSMRSGTIHLDSHAIQSNSLVQRNGQPVVLLLGEVADGRKEAPARKVGDIRSTVIDMASSALVLDQNVSAQVFNALKDQLAADGIRTVSDPHVPHDIEVATVAKDFRLDIVDRDELNIDVDMILRDAKTGDVLWAGSVAEKSSRFAGVAGNSRASIVSYFNKGLNSWAIKASANVRDSLFRSYPQTMTISERKELVPSHLEGVTTLQEVKSQEAVAKTPAATPSIATPAIEAAPATPAVAPPATVAAIVAAPNSKGIFSVTTAPSKAKVYVDDVYYGTSPLKLELDPGVTLFRFKLEGYKTVTQKVSIRRGETTELEVKFEK